MRRLIFQVAVGEVPAFYGPCMASMRAYAERIGADYEALAEPELRIVPKKSQRSENALRLGYLPIFEKEAGFSRLGEYDKVAIIDADVYAMPHAPDIFSQAHGFDFCGVPERKLPLLPQYTKKVRSYARDQYGNSEFSYFNMGVTVWDKNIANFLHGDTPKQFIERPEFEKFVNGEGKYRWSTDQTLLNTWLYSHRELLHCRNLSWEWNCMYDYVRPDELVNAHFMHFALAAKMPRGGAEIPEIIARLS